MLMTTDNWELNKVVPHPPHESGHAQHCCHLRHLVMLLGVYHTTTSICLHVGRAVMDFSSAFQRLLPQLHSMLWDDNLRFLSHFLPHINNWVYYIADIMLPCEDPPLLQDILLTVLVHLWGRRWVVNLQKIQGTDTATKFWRVAWLVKTYIVPETIIKKVQVHPISKNTKRVQDFIGIWDLGRIFIPCLAQCLHLL